MIIRAAFTVAFSTYSIVFNILVLVNDQEESEQIDGIDDKLHDWTAPINQYFAEDNSRRNALIIAAGICMDFVITFQGVRLIIYGRTFRFFLAAMTFYTVRFLIQFLAVLQFPKEGYIWDYPGWPALFVPYGQTPDFFYSGHTGILFM